MGGKNLEVVSLGAIGEPVRESASALVDGETGEFETRRLLEQTTPELRALLDRHYTVRAVLRREADLLCPPALTASILAALEREPLPGRVGAVPGWQRWAGGAAIAASVCLVAVFGTRTLLQPEQAAEPSFVAAPSPIVLGSPDLRVVTDTRGPVSLPRVPQNDPDGFARERLQMFMMEHAANSALNTPEGMMPYARVVSHEEP